jgi:DNA-binding NarL/FixJ family response regulator
MRDPIHILLVDDSIVFLEALTYALRACPNLVIVGYAESGSEALEQARRLQPDVVVMDISMSRMNGLEATRHLKAQPHAPYVVILTMHDNAEYRTAAAAVGADGFVNKLSCDDELPALLTTLRGRLPHSHAPWKGEAAYE